MIITRLNKLRCTAAILGAIALVGLNPLVAFAGTSIVSKSQPAQQRFVSAKASAYSSGAADNAQWVGRTAIGTSLRSGAINSAASDWSKFPLGTKFRVVETGKIYQVDDYGSAMVGKMKVDLFTPSTKQMDKVGCARRDARNSRMGRSPEEPRAAHDSRRGALRPHSQDDRQPARAGLRHPAISR